MGYNIIYSCHIAGYGVVTVYENGLGTYKKVVEGYIKSVTRTTVFNIHDIKLLEDPFNSFKSRSKNEPAYTMDEEEEKKKGLKKNNSKKSSNKVDVNSFEVDVLLTHYGEDRIARNIHDNSNSKSTEYFDEVKYACSSQNTYNPSNALDNEITEAQMNDMMALLYDAINTLPANQKETLVGYYFASCTEQDMADFLHIPRTTVEYRKYAAKNKLQKKLLETFDDSTINDVLRNLILNGYINF